jgi:hypothetical protein
MGREQEDVKARWSRRLLIVDVRLMMVTGVV